MHLLNNSDIDKLDNLSLKARYIVEGFILGLHKSPYHGFSVEFSENRKYEPGDEMKFIDWKVWAKTDRYYVKQFEEETNLLCYILIDQSNSMKYKSKQTSKLDYVKILASAFSYLILKQQDAVGLISFDEKIKKFITPKSKPSQLKLLTSTLENLNPGNETSISKVLHQVADTINKKGLIILFSDLLDNKEDILSSLKHFRFDGHEVIVFHSLDPNEINFEFSGNIEFRDLENETKIKTDPRLIAENYKKNFKQFYDDFKASCRKNKIDYIQLNTNISYDKFLIDYLLKRKNLK
jgi:uncharacterized protein (DUF58 family)